MCSLVFVVVGMDKLPDILWTLAKDPNAID